MRLVYLEENREGLRGNLLMLLGLFNNYTQPQERSVTKAVSETIDR